MSLLLRSRHPLIFIETEEKDRAESLLLHVAEGLGLPFHVWTRTKGLFLASELPAEHVANLGQYAGEVIAALPKAQRTPASLTVQPLTALGEVEKYNRAAVYNFQGLAEDLSDPVLATKLADAVKQFLKHEGAVVVTGAAPSELPHVLRPFATVLELPTPQFEEYRRLAEEIYRDLSKRTYVELHITKDEMRRLVNSLQGLTLLEAEKILTKAMLEDNRLSVDDIGRITEAKQNIVAREGLLEYYPVEETLEDVAGLPGLKAWLKKRRALVQKPEEAKAFGLEFPKGLLLLGVQGSGKSLCAKAVASDWGLPLLKMDPSGLYNKYIGETERNFRRATKLAEKMAPVVLWIDEIEKAFASGGDMDGGVSQRVLGAFLSWLQERRGDVFVVATANEVSKLPPELLRKGRFDEIFFVDLPAAATRAEILALHLKKRKRDAGQFDLSALAAQTEGFSGAELEQVVVSGLYTAFAEGEPLNDSILEIEARQTVPLSVTMAEKLAALRSWAEVRAVRA